MTISRNGGVVSGNGAGNEIVVSVGEQVQLTATITGQPAGTTIVSQSWQVNGTVVGGWNLSEATYQPTGAPASAATASPDLSNASTTLYWVDAGVKQVTYNATLNNGAEVGASVAFSVIGPTGSMTTLFVDQTICSSTDTRVLPPGAPCVNAVIIDGYHPPVAAQYGPTGNTYSCVGLDTDYPYQAANSAVGSPIPTDDSPYLSLNDTYAERKAIESFVMTLMFMPNTENAIFVPVAIIAFSGAARWMQ